MTNRPALRPTLKTAPVKQETVEDMIANARSLAERNVPTFIPALRAASIVVDPNLPSVAAIDKYWRTYWQADGVSWFVKAAAAVSKTAPCPTCNATSHNKYAYLAGIWIHEVGHCVFQHSTRQEAGYPKRGRWNMAADLEMNDDIPGIGEAAEKQWQAAGAMCPRICLPSHAYADPTAYALWSKLGSAALKLAMGLSVWDLFVPTGLHTPAMKKVPFLMFPANVPDGQGGFVALPENQIAEIYYDLMTEMEQNSPGPEELADHGSGSDDEPRDWEVGEGDADGSSPGISEAEAQAIRREVASAVKKAAEGRGYMPAGWKLWADTTLQPSKVRWQDKLQARLRRAINRVRGNKHTTFRRLSRVSITQNCAWIKPSTYSTVPNIYVVLDTSGSMGSGAGSRLERALSEVEAIIKQLHCQVFFIDCDAAVYGAAQQITSVIKARVSGGGGTDMRIGIRAALKSKPKPDVIILLTDGDTDYPTASELRGVSMVTALCAEKNGYVKAPLHMNPFWVED